MFTIYDDVTNRTYECDNMNDCIDELNELFYEAMEDDTIDTDGFEDEIEHINKIIYTKNFKEYYSDLLRIKITQED